MRTEKSYVIIAGKKMLKVLAALEGRNFEPVSIKRVSERTKLPFFFCRSALLTLKDEGWAKQVLDGKESLWILGPKAENMGKRLAAASLSAAG